MEHTHNPAVAQPLAPVSSNERIQALDVVRGFALIGIMMMNVEFFNRPMAELGMGLAPGLTGANYWVGMFIQYFVIGKFWTIFSLLFGMGFAVMLTRAERAGRSFLVPYMRRIAALATFGALHHTFLFAGDILFSYAVAATALLIVLYGRPWFIFAGVLACVGLGFVPGMDWLFGVAGGVAFFGLSAWWLRGEKLTKGMPAIAMFFLVLGLLLLLVGAGLWAFVPAAPPPAKFMLPVVGVVVMILGLLTKKYHDPQAARAWRLGVGIYCFSFTMMIAGGIGMYFAPPPAPAKPAPAAAAVAKSAPPAAAAKPAAPNAEAERAKRLKERAERVAKEHKLMSGATYGEMVQYRAHQFVEHAAGEVGFATLLIGMFLLGTWFVRSGIMENTQAHLPLFRRFATICLPLGVGLGLAGALITTQGVPGSMGKDGWQIAQGMLLLGNLPACLGYVSVLILALHSGGVFAKVNVLAPFGRMALTNYLTQSLLMSLVFLGHGLGYYGASRVDQMLFVAAVVAVQILFSHVWLSYFRYGPMEWLWRAVTYWQIPPLRIEARLGAPTVPSAA